MKNINIATILGILIMVIGIIPFVMPTRVDPAEGEELKDEVRSIFENVQELIASILNVKDIFGKNEVEVVE
jgi:hypothetical protein